MDKPSVNWNALDSLVLEYAEIEQLLIDSGGNSSNSFTIRSTINDIRKLIEQGSVGEALDSIERLAPSVLQDQRLLFQLYKQKFIELLRSKDVHSQDQAIQSCRNVLRPCALNAYPEAYQEFKRLLLAFIYRKEDDNSPVVEQWSDARRFELAARVASVLKAQLHAYDPLFALTLRYLISIHNSFCFRHGRNSSIAKICEMLLEKEKDPAPAPYDCLLEAPKFNESDVQALAHAVDLSRQEAIDSLRYAGGDVTLALKNELSRMNLNVKVVDELVYNYCVYRGLIDGNTESRRSDVSEKRDGFFRVKHEHAENMSTRSDTSVEGTEHISVLQEWETVADRKDTMMEDQAESNFEHCVMGDSSRGDSCTQSESNCSTSGQPNLTEKKNGVIWENRQNFPRKRWKGRSMTSHIGNEKRVCMGNGKMASATTKVHDIARDHAEQNEIPEVNKLELALEIRELVCKGMITEVIQKVKDLNPQFFECNPRFLFQLKQMEFFKLVEEGNYTEALSIARTVLGPLAFKDSDLLRPLKETVLAFVKPQEESSLKPVFASVLGASLQVELNASLGISEPDLMNVIKVALQSHNEWFEIQMCPDPFAKILGIDVLKDTEFVCSGPSIVSESSTGSSKLGSSKVVSVTDDGNLHKSETSRSGFLFDDNSILTVMEWMALPRGDAIQLLAQYDGSVESVLEHML